eukprot:jgi/Galph1/3116/GphlegSOOS_G1823.1
MDRCQPKMWWWEHRCFAFVNNLLCLKQYDKRSLLWRQPIPSCIHRKPLLFSIKKSIFVARLQEESNVTTSNSDKKEQLSTPQKSQKDTVSELLTLYGPVYIVVSLTLSAISLTCFYVLVSSGVNVTAWFHWINDQLEHYSIGRINVLENVSPNLGALLLLISAASPIRFPITVATTPFVANWWKKRKQHSK